MIKMTNELKAKLLAAQSAEEAAALVKADGQEITSEDAAQLWEEIAHKREQDGKELSLDELDAVSGGVDRRDWLQDGCAATVEPKSHCWSNDRCDAFEVFYDFMPQDYCPQCGGMLYEAGYSDSMQQMIYKCKSCGHLFDHNKFWIENEWRALPLR